MLRQRKVPKRKATLSLRPLRFALGQPHLYATLPQVLPQLISYTLYRWENNTRAAIVLGVVGAGDLGQMLAFHMGMFQMGETSTVLLAMFALVDGASYGLRKVLA